MLRTSPRCSTAPASSSDALLDESAFLERGALAFRQTPDHPLYGLPGPQPLLEKRVTTTTPGLAGSGREALTYFQGAPPAGFSVPRPLPEYHSGYGCSDVEPCSASPSPSHRTAHGRQHSLTNLLQFGLSRIGTPPQSPQVGPPRRLYPDDQDDMAFTGDGRKRREHTDAQGHVAPQSQMTVSESAASPDTTPTKLSKGQNAETTPKGNNPPAPAPAPSRLAQFASSISQTFSHKQPQITPEMHEELLKMSVEEALFPAGSPTSRDTFSPAAFKNLKTNAVGLLVKMQAAYRQKAASLQDMEREREAQCEELEEAETRATHLKMQLDDFASQASEQERRMKSLMEELAAEKKARRTADERASFMAARDSKSMDMLPPIVQSEGSTISEDLGVDDAQQKRKWRRSDTSFETDEESLGEGESVFSRPRSPSRTPSTFDGSTVDGPTSSSCVPTSSRSAARSSVVAPKRKSTAQMSTFQKLMKNISGDSAAETSSCLNCKGQDASVAWDTVSLLRDENKQLKQRVGELEGFVESALDAANGVGI